MEKADKIIADGRERAQTLINEARQSAEAAIEESAAEAKRNVSAAQSQVDLLTKQRRTITAQLEQLRSMFAAPGLFDGIDFDEDKSDQVKASAVPTQKIASETDLEKLRHDAEAQAEKKSVETESATASAHAQEPDPSEPTVELKKPAHPAVSKPAATQAQSADSAAEGSDQKPAQ